MSLSAGEIRDPVEITFDDPVPIPRSLLVTASATELSGAGATTQVLVTGSLATGTVVNLTASSTGTSYRVSNPQIAQVSEEGLVTALTSGPVLVIATNDGATGLVRVQIIASSDSDGDGIPDDVEIANGLNPNDPVDALEDLDRDGLSNRDEIAAGTGLRVADTDGDGLLDGREPDYNTNPLLFDTDGDGVSDGLEVSSGSDPNDASSVNLALVLESIDVQPAELRIIVNALRVLPPEQLVVTGRLRDGRTLVLTSRDRGTTYSTANPLVASFGGEDGQVFGGETGVTTVTVRVPGFTANVGVTVTNFEPGIVGSVPLPDGVFAEGLALRGDELLVAGGAAGLLVYDVSNKIDPALIATRPLQLDGQPLSARDVKVYGNVAYLATARGLGMFDVSNPAAPTSLGIAPLSSPPLPIERITLNGDVAVLSAGSQGLRVVSLTSPGSPVLLPDDPRTQQGGSGPLAAAGSTLLRPGTVLNPGGEFTPGMEVLALDGGITRPMGVVGLGSAYPTALAAELGTGYAGGPAGFAVVDISNPGSPSVASSIDESQSGQLRDMALVQGFVIGVGSVADGAQLLSASVIDVSDPQNARVAYRPEGPLFGHRVVADESYFFASGLDPFTNDPRLLVGQYLQIEDTRGLPPSVSLVSPESGPLAAGVLEQFEVIASDDREVAKVTLLIDGLPVAADTSRPYSFQYRVPLDATGLRVEVEAEDFGGNRTRTPPVDFAVVVDTPPVVSFITPLPGQLIHEGSPLAVEVGVTSATGLARTEVWAQSYPGGAYSSTEYAESPPTTAAALQRTFPALPVGSGQIYVDLVARATGRTGLVTIQTLRLPVRTPNGGAPPVVDLVQPGDGAVFYEGNEAILYATASDDGGIQRIRLLLNGAVVGENTFGPFVTAAFVPGLESEALVRVEAEDAAGQVSVVERVVPILPDPGPVIDLQPWSSVVQGVRQTFRAFVTDNSAVASVVFRFNGEAVSPLSSGTEYTADYTVLTSATELLVEVEATDNRGTVSQASLSIPVETGSDRFTPETVDFSEVAQPYLPNIIAGNGIPGSINDEDFGIFGRVNAPTWLAVHPQTGDIYFVDSGTNRVRRLSSGITSTVAGSGAADFSGDGGPALLAAFNQIEGIAFNDAGELYIADAGNGRIRRIGMDGIVTTVAGSGGPVDAGPRSGRSPLDVALNEPSSVAIAPDAPGGEVLYIADTKNHQIWELRDGLMSVLAGAGPAAPGYSGDSLDFESAHIGEPVSLRVEAGALLVTDRRNGAVFALNLTTRGLRTVAGTGVPGYSGDDGLARVALLNGPAAQVEHPFGGAVVLADRANGRVRMVTPDQRIVTVAGTGGQPPVVELTPLSEPLEPFGLAFLPPNCYYCDSSSQAISVAVSEPNQHLIKVFELNAASADLPIGGPPNREILAVALESPVNWISLKRKGTIRDMSLVAFPGLVPAGFYEIPLIVRITVRDLSQCDASGVCAEFVVTETVMVSINVQRRD